jgi:hypothetical protein
MCVKCVCLNFSIFVFWVVETFGFGGDFGVLAFLELGKNFNVCGCFLKLIFFFLLNLEVGFWVDDELCCIHDLERKKKEVRISGISF